MSRGFSVSGSQQSGQSGEVIGDHGEDEAGAHPLDATIDGLRHAIDGFGPAEGLFYRQLHSEGGGGRSITSGSIPTDHQVALCAEVVPLRGPPSARLRQHCHPAWY